MKFNCLILLCLLSTWVLGQRSHETAGYDGVVYFIPHEEVMMGYGDHLYDNPVIGEVTSGSLQIREADQYETPFPGVTKGSQFGIVYTSTLVVEQEGCYAFSLGSDDGSMLWLDGSEVINNDKPHKFRFKYDTVSLVQKEYDLKLWYYNAFPPLYGLKFDITYMGPAFECDLLDTKKEVTLTLGDIQFELDSYQVTEAGVDTIEAFCRSIGTSGIQRISVTGHTDSSGSSQYNTDLSMLRSQAVAEIIGDFLDLDHDILFVEGMGELEPLASNSTVEGRRKNRRVEVVVELK